MHLKTLLVLLLVLVLAHEIEGWFSRSGQRSWSSRRRSVFSSRRRSDFGTRRRSVFSSRRRSFFSSRRRSVFSSRRRSLFGTRRRSVFSSRRRSLFGTRRRSVFSSRRRSLFGTRRRSVFSSRRRSLFGTRRRSVFSSRRRSWFGTRRRSTRRRSFPHSVKTKSGLRNLYNSKVVHAYRVFRPLQGWLGKLGIKHSGVIVTTANGKRWLIHKGKRFGKSGQTVVVDPKHMSNKWKYGQACPLKKAANVGTFVKAGGRKYNFLFNNCHNASCRMCRIGR